jgi:signal transduction histidine kinase
VAQVVDAHGGRVEASAADGGGTVVTMQLPPAPTDG